MKCHLLGSLLLLPILVPPLLSQMDVNAGDVPLKSAPIQMQAPTAIFVSGKVVLDDGSSLPDRAEVITICNGEKRTRARSDSRGGFSFSLTTESSGTSQSQSASSGSDTSWGGPMAPRRTEPEWEGCELEAVLSGFKSEKIPFQRRFTGLGQNDIGQIVLHRTTRADGLTVSVTEAMAPESARKVFKKALEQAAKSHWDEAQAGFEKAVQIYPKYATAWFELGRIHARNHNEPETRRCWERALAADPKYLPPYQMLSEADAGAGRWAELVEITGKWLALDSSDFVEPWFLNAVGNYFIGNLAVAEESARQGMTLDQEHRIPKLQYLLGMVLMQKRAYGEAEEHMQFYLHLVNKPADIDEAQKQLSEIQRLGAKETPIQSAEK